MQNYKGLGGDEVNRSSIQISHSFDQTKELSA